MSEVVDISSVLSLDLDEELLYHLAIQDSWITLQGEHFDVALLEDETVAAIYTWQKAHQREHGRIASLSVLADEWKVEFYEPETSIGDLLDRLRLRYMKNGGREVLRDLVTEAKEGDPLLVPQMLLRRGRELNQLLAKQGEVFGTGDLDRAMHRYDFKASQGAGASTGFSELDEYFYGLRGVCFLIGWKKTFKSWLMIQALASNIAQGRYPWLYSLELPAEETDMRLRFLLAGLPWWKYHFNKITIEDRKLLKAVSDQIDGLGMYKIVKPPRGQRGVADMVNRARDAGSEVVLIDQLQYVENDRAKSLGRLNDTGEYFGVLDEARNLSDEGPIYFAHQFGRQAMGSESMPDISMAKGSSSVEEVCTLALGLWANKDMRRSNKVELATLMSRNANAFPSWELDVELSKGCDFKVARLIEDE